MNSIFGLPPHLRPALVRSDSADAAAVSLSPTPPAPPESPAIIGFSRGLARRAALASALVLSPRMADAIDQFRLLLHACKQIVEEGVVDVQALMGSYKNLSNCISGVIETFPALKSLAHDLRTPIQNASSFAEKLIGEEDPFAVDRDVMKIRHFHAQMESLIVQMSGKAEPDGEWNVKDLLDTLLEDNLLAAEKKGVDLRLQIDGVYNVNVIGKRLQIERVLGNFLRNAFNYGTIDGRGVVTIYAKLSPVETTALHIEFLIRDRGLGITADKLEQLGVSDRIQLDTFLRDAELQAQSSGVGIHGSVQLIEGMGGKFLKSSRHISEVSNEEQSGSSFGFSLTLRREALRSVSVSPCPARSSASEKFIGTPPRILLADDEGTIRKTASFVFTRAGAASVLSVESGSALMERILDAPQNYDVIIADMNMEEGRTGLELLTEIMQLYQDRGLRLPILILCTGDSDIRPSEEWNCISVIQKGIGANLEVVRLVNRRGHKSVLQSAS